jgi:hypothetical protein
LHLKKKEEEIDGIAAYAATQPPSFHQHITGFCTDLVNDNDEYTSFRNSFYARPDLVDRVESLQLHFQSDKSLDAQRIKIRLTKLLGGVSEDRGEDIIKMLKAEVLHREQLNATDNRPSGLKQIAKKSTGGPTVG